MSYLERLQRLSTHLSTVESSARRAEKAVRSTVESAAVAQSRLGAVEETHGRLISSLAKGATETSGFLETYQNVASEAERTVGVVSSSRERIKEGLDEVEQAVERTNKRLSERLTEFSQQATRLDDLKVLIQEGTSLWDQELKSWIAAVEVGIKSMDELLTRFGDGVVAGKRLREFLDDMPFDYYERRLRDLIFGLKDGGKSVEDVVKLLQESQLEFAQRFAQILELFRQGKATLQLVLDAAEEAKRLFPDTQFAELADVIADGLATGDLT